MRIPFANLEAYQSRSQFFYSIILRSSNKYLLGWESVKTQSERFRIFLEEFSSLMPSSFMQQGNEKVPADFSLLDAGCGYGALYAYLHERKVSCAYTGMDYSKECIREAQSLYGDDAKFFRANLFEPTLQVGSWGTYDLCFISGVLNVNIEKITHIGANYEVMLFVIEKLLSISHYGVIFNVLHVKSPAQDDTFFYYDPQYIVKFLQSNGIRVVAMRDDYLSNDMTLIVKKDMGCDTDVVTFSN